MFAGAKQAQIIRANQKDEHHQNRLKSLFNDVVQLIYGSGQWIRWHKEYDVLADLGYLLLTTVAGYQTLGEEYVNILLVDSSMRKVPTFTRRLCMSSLQVLGPYLFDRSLLFAEKKLRMSGSVGLRSEARDQLLAILPTLRHIVTILHRCHLTAFYMSGLYYHFSKRLTSIKYLQVRSSLAGGSTQLYRVLAWLGIAQLIGSFLVQVIQFVRASQLSVMTKTSYSSREKQSQVVSEDPKMKCVLCLEIRQHTTATPCGHLFCWDCITEWCTNKAECPLCREQFQLSRLVPLMNFDPLH